MCPAWEILPIELWELILLFTVGACSLVHIDDDTQDQHTFERAFRPRDIGEQNRIRQEQEFTRQNVRLVCSQWRAFVDRSFGGWVEVNYIPSTNIVNSFTISTAWRIDCSVTSDRAPRQELLPESNGAQIPATSKGCRARILTINSKCFSIDSLLRRQGHLFTCLQVLDLRPASTFLTPTGGVSGGPDFFPTLATLFTQLSVLLVDLPASDVPDALDFPRLRRLSYNIIGQSRLVDWKRCASIGDWKLPMIEHISLNPVGCGEDWQLVMSAMKAWGSELKSLCWDAEFPHPMGITIGATDWSVCPVLTNVKYDVKTVQRDGGNGQCAGAFTPPWHPFNRIPVATVHNALPTSS